MKATAPIGPRLQTRVALRHGPHGAQGGDGVGGAAGDVELFLGADDQVEEVQRRLQLGGDLGAIR